MLKQVIFQFFSWLVTKNAINAKTFSHLFPSSVFGSLLFKAIFSFLELLIDSSEVIFLEKMMKLAYIPLKVLIEAIQNIF